MKNYVKHGKKINMMKTNIDSIFHNLRIPSSNNYTCEKFNNSNLWIVKDDDGRCGILIDNVINNKKFKDYKNLEIEEIKSLSTDSIVLNNVLMVRHNDSIIPKLFSESLNTYFSINLKKKYDIKDLQNALDEIEAITKSSRDKLNEIVGVWGEFYIIHFLLINSSSNFHKHIINSWESPDGRSLIDLTLNVSKINIEVKTTTSDNRIHHISTLNQVQQTEGFNGFLASICIKEGEGLSCYEFKNNINKIIGNENAMLFNQRVKIRGESLCNNTNFSFVINNEKKPKYFKFSDVPKPTIVNDILKVEWDLILENVDFINEHEILEKINLS